MHAAVFGLRLTVMSSHILFVDLVALPEGPHPIPFRTRSLSPPGPMVLCLKARESRSPPGLPRGCTHSSPTDPSSRLYSGHRSLAAKFAAGWSSPVARQAHNLKVIGSNPIPAPKFEKSPPHRRAFLLAVNRKPRSQRALSPLHLANRCANTEPYGSVFKSPSRCLVCCALGRHPTR